MTVQSVKSNASIIRTFWNNGNVTQPPTSFTASNTNYTIKGNPSCPTHKSDYSADCFTPGYNMNAEFLDYLA